jgi:hypothetical protein
MCARLAVCYAVIAIDSWQTAKTSAASKNQSSSFMGLAL